MLRAARQNSREKGKRLEVTKERLDGLYLLFLGAAVCILLGSVLSAIAPAKMSDFNAVFYGSRCLIHHSDPYQSDNVLREFRMDGGRFPSDPAIARPYQRAILSSINLPTSLMLVAPFAWLPSGPAHLLWMILMTASLLAAAYLMWDIGAAISPILAGALAGFIIANSEALLINGNVSGLAIGLGLVALWCFIKDRFTGIGIFCLALGLAFKPHDIGLIWLYLFLAGGTLRRYAIQVLAIIFALGVLAVVWVSNVAPNWTMGFHSNMLTNFAHGDLNDPGPASMGAHTLGMMVNLQTIVSIFRDNPNFYNPVTYLIIGPLILVWALVTLKSQLSTEKTWIALAAISALSLLPVYHRIYDAKILLLSIPACAMLAAKGGTTGRLAVCLNSLAILFTSDLVWVLFSLTLRHLHLAMPWLPFSVWNALIVFPAPTALLAMGIFYLWIYAKKGNAALRQPSPAQERV